MNVIVCIKQVPATTKVDIDETTGVLKRDSAQVKLNPYDLYTIETALCLASDYGGDVTAITMGPPPAVTVLREALAMGVDKGVLISDKAFAGADVLATAYALSQTIRSLPKFDLILCGKQTTDGDTAQVGAELAELMDIPHIANVISVLDVSGSYLTAEADMGNHIYIIRMKLPCLLTLEKGCCIPRLPSYKRMVQTQNDKIPVIGLTDLADSDSANYGLNGSPTQVERIFPPEASGENLKLAGSADEVADEIYRLLLEHKLIGG